MPAVSLAARAARGEPEELVRVIVTRSGKLGCDLRVWASAGAKVDDLGARGIRRLMVEGGEHVHTQFLSQGLADELHLTIGGFFVTDPAAPRFVTPGVRLPQDSAHRMRLAGVSQAGETAVLRYLLR